MNNTLHVPMKKYERIAGWIWLPVHMFLLSFAVAWLCGAVLPLLGLRLTGSWPELLYYAVSALFVLTVLFPFMKASFHALCENFWRALADVLFGYVFYYILLYAASFLLSLLLDNLTNPNTEGIITQAKFNPNVILVVAVILAPIAEEALFRGVAFGTLYKKSRVLAYAVSTLLFAVYHLWDYLLIGFDWHLLLYLIQYVPGAVALGWCYARSGTIWAPILLHAMINYISISVSLG